MYWQLRFIQSGKSNDIGGVVALYFLSYIIISGVVRLQLWKLRKRELFNVIIFMAISIVAILILIAIGTLYSKNIVISSYGIIVILLIVCMDMLFFKILTGLIKEKQQTQDYNMLEQKISGQEQYLKNVKQLDTQIRVLRHDMDNQLKTVEFMMNTGLYDAASRHIDSYKEAVENISNYIVTDNEVVNAVLNSKIAAAKRENIVINTSVHKHIKKMEDLDICSLLGNLLDNAVEAELRLPKEKRHIEFVMLWEYDEMIIKISNNIEKSVLSENENLNTSKPDKENHGFGTKIIEDIVNKYNGMYDIYEEYNMFFCEIRW